MQRRLCIVILTRNEAANIEGCLKALAAQDHQDFEVLLLDAASTDDTVERALRLRHTFPVPLRVEVATHRQPIGEARNLGARLATTPYVAYLSADAEPEPDWVRRALTHLDRHGMVFGRQRHAPRRWSVAAAVRGLRYRFPRGPIRDALPLASNVAAAFHRSILLDHPFADHADAAEDLLLALRAARDGHTAHYDPGLLVRHHDVQTAREELHKVVREGRAWGRHHAELGPVPMLLAWGAALVATAPFASLAPRLLGRAWTGLLWVPAVARARRTRDEPHGMPPSSRLVGILASPAFDLAFLAHYLAGRIHALGHRARSDTPSPPGQPAPEPPGQPTPPDSSNPPDPTPGNPSVAPAPPPAASLPTTHPRRPQHQDRTP